MHVVVTGAAGYIGSVAVKRLVEVGHRVTALDNLTYGIGGAGIFEPLGVDFIQGDIRAAREKWFKGADAVIHLAGISNDPTADVDPGKTDEINVDGTRDVVCAAYSAGVRRFIYASSASIYDDGTTPIETDAWRTENDSITPLGAYSISKLTAEAKLLTLQERLGFSATVLRQGTVYGLSPRTRMDLVVQTMIRSALTDSAIDLHNGGLNWRPLVSVNNLAGVYLRFLLAAGTAGFDIYNIVDQNAQIKGIAQMIVAAFLHFGRNIKIVAQPAPVGMRSRDYRVAGTKYAKRFGKLAPGLTSEIYALLTTLSTWNSTRLYAPQLENLRWLERNAPKPVPA